MYLYNTIERAAFKVKRYHYKSKGGHVDIKLDLYTPRETFDRAKAKFSKWKSTPKNERKKPFKIKLTRK